MMQSYLDGVDPIPESDKIVGIVVPHAGYRYSGGIAAASFANITNRSFDTVVIIGPLHRPITNVTGMMLTTAHSAYKTPLGEVEVDRELLNQIKHTVEIATVRNDPEHSIEIELPFLQHVLKTPFRLVPLMLVNQSHTRALTDALTELLRGRHALIVASSDLSHFNPQHVAHEMDEIMLEASVSMQSANVIDVQRRRTGYACGYGAIAVAIDVINSLYRTPTACLLGYGTSGDVTGSYLSVVGYGAIAYMGEV
jgi:AmmeMemoRadiSam system protein B